MLIRELGILGLIRNDREFSRTLDGGSVSEALRPKRPFDDILLVAILIDWYGNVRKTYFCSQPCLRRGFESGDHGGGRFHVGLLGTYAQETAQGSVWLNSSFASHEGFVTGTAFNVGQIDGRPVWEKNGRGAAECKKQLDPIE